MNFIQLEKNAEEYAEENKEVDWEGFDLNKREIKEAYLAGELKINDELEKWKSEWQEMYYKYIDESWERTKTTMENTKLKEEKEKLIFIIETSPLHLIEIDEYIKEIRE